MFPNIALPPTEHPCSPPDALPWNVFFFNPVDQTGAEFGLADIYWLPGLPAKGTYKDLGIDEPTLDQMNGVNMERRKSRLKLSSEQKSHLLTAFHNFPYVNDQRMKEIAELLGITEKQVQVWFQNRRRLVRRQKNENVKSVGRMQNAFVGFGE